MIERMYRRIRWAYPKWYVKWIEKNIVYAGMEIKVERFITLSFLYSLSFSFFIFSVLLLFNHLIIALISLPILFILFQLIFDLIVIFIGDNRGGFAELVLPDALQLMSANIKSGLTPDKALLFAARPEFGILEKEIKLAASKAVAGEPIEDALIELGSRIKSRIINRTFALIVEGMKKGGEIASLLEQTAEDVRDLKLLKKEISAQVSMYSIFILIAVGFASPLLFAFSSYLVETMSIVGSSLKLEEASRYAVVGSIRLGVINIPPNFLKFYSLLLLSSSSIFGSLLVGLLQEGKESAGIKYIPILLSLNISIFFFVRSILSVAIGFFVPTGGLQGLV
ncbi:MAG: type II secretion system F family protein [Candidatus Aenigmatarchaeota archaeon]